MHKRLDKRAFTIVELVVVMAVLAILVLLGIPKLIGYTEEAKITQIKHDVKVVDGVIEEYLIENHKLPEGLKAIDIDEALMGRKIYDERGLVTFIDVGALDGVEVASLGDNLFMTNTLNEGASRVFYDITEMDVVKAVKSKLKGQFVSNEDGRVYYGHTKALGGSIVGDKDKGSEGDCPEKIDYPEYDFDHTTGTIVKYNGNQQHITIPSAFKVDGLCYPVRIIGRGAFAGKGIISITLPDTIIIIENEAFDDNEIVKVVPEDYVGNDNIVIIPPSVKEIGDNAFKNNKIEIVVIPGSVEKIGKETFKYNKIREVEFKNPTESKLKEVGDNAFSNNELTYISLPDRVIKIGKDIVSENNVNTISLPKDLKVIPENAFSGVGIISVVIPEGVERIEDYAFAWNQLEGVNIPDSVKYIGNYAFAYNEKYNQLGEVIPSIGFINIQGSNHIDSLDSLGNIVDSSNNKIDMLNSRVELKDSIFYIENETTEPEKPEEPNTVNVTHISGGTAHSMAIKKDGSVWSWGRNNNGQFGNGTTTDSLTPVKAVGLSDVVYVTGNELFSTALKSNGTVWAWGRNSNGHLGNGTTENRNTPGIVPNLTNVVAIAAHAHTLALKSDGTVWGWGYNQYGQLGNGATGYVQSIPVQASNLTNVKAIAVGRNHSLALKNDGTVWGWGYSGNGQIGAGHFHHVNNRPTEVKNLKDVVAIAAGRDHSLALKNDGTVWIWGEGRLGNGITGREASPIQVEDLRDVVSISAGYYHSLAIKSDGTVWAWGSNGSGQLGVGDTSVRSRPAQVKGLSDVVYVTGGEYHSFAMKSDGTVWGWGDNYGGRLGGGPTNSYVSTPVKIRILEE